MPLLYVGMEKWRVICNFLLMNATFFPIFFQIWKGNNKNGGLGCKTSPPSFSFLFIFILAKQWKITFSFPFSFPPFHTSFHPNQTQIYTFEILPSIAIPNKPKYLTNGNGGIRGKDHIYYSLLKRKRKNRNRRYKILTRKPKFKEYNKCTY